MAVYFFNTMLHALIQKIPSGIGEGGGYDNVFKTVRRALNASGNVRLDSVLLMSTITVRDIICISLNIHHLKKLKLCIFNIDLKLRLQKVIYLGYA